MDRNEDWSRTRIVLTLVGAAGGGSFWWLFERLPDMLQNERALLFVTMAVLGFFLELMALAGPVRLSRATFPALAFSLLVAGLAIWASLRFQTSSEFLGVGHLFAAPFIIYVVGTPFLSVFLENGRAGWRSYPDLFQTAWSVIVRFAASGVFTGVFWGVLMLCHALLDLVGIDVIETLLEQDGAPFVITGAVVGLALAVAHEWRQFVSPLLLLRLLRLLVPMLVPVLVLFLVAVVVSGLDQVLGGVSTTALLTSVAVGCVTLITVSVDRDPLHQVQVWPMRWGVRVMAVLLLPIVGLSAWGVQQQIRLFGWTPDQVLLSICLGVLGLYGLLYLSAVLRRGDWGTRIRQTNVGLALLTLVLAVLWLTPVLNAERLSTRAQVSRLKSGTIDPENASIWEMTQRWGLAGKDGIAQLAETADFPQRDRVLQLVERARHSDSRLVDPDRGELSRARRVAQVADLLTVLPAATVLPAGAFDGLSDWMIDETLDACARLYEDGAPGCLFLQVRFWPTQAGQQGILFLRSDQRSVQAHAFVLSDGVLTQRGQVTDLAKGVSPELDEGVLPKLRAGTYRIAPAPVNVLDLGGMALFPAN